MITIAIAFYAFAFLVFAGLAICEYKLRRYKDFLYSLVTAVVMALAVAMWVVILYDSKIG